MIKINKRPLPPKPIKCEKDYQGGPNFTALSDDCFNKCYICEHDRPTSISVEHRVATSVNPILKYHWHNLFFACRHCNEIKLDNYNNIIDPSACDPEDYIALSLPIDDNIKEAKVLISARSDDESTKETAELLDIVYNGGKTTQKDQESVNLRNIISENLARFTQYKEGYKDEPDEDLLKVYRDKIEHEISRASAFAAFKRQIVREDSALSDKFAAALV